MNRIGRSSSAQERRRAFSRAMSPVTSKPKILFWAGRSRRGRSAGARPPSVLRASVNALTSASTFRPHSSTVSPSRATPKTATYSSALTFGQRASARRTCSWSEFGGSSSGVKEPHCSCSVCSALDLEPAARPGSTRRCRWPERGQSRGEGEGDRQRRGGTPCSSRVLRFCRVAPPATEPPRSGAMPTTRLCVTWS